MGRYLQNSPESDVIPNLTNNIDRVAQVLVKKKLAEQEREAKFEDEIKLLREKQKIESEDPMHQFNVLGERAKVANELRNAGWIDSTEVLLPQGVLGGGKINQQPAAMPGMPLPSSALTMPSAAPVPADPGMRFDGKIPPNVRVKDYEMTPANRLRPKSFESIPTEEEFQRELDRKMEETKAKKVLEGVSGENAGRVTLAKESLTNIDDVMKLLFPTGEAQSFNRELSWGANPPAVRLPFIGRVGSPVRRDNPLDPSDNAKAQASQNIFRKLGASLSGRQLIQTGVAARPEETERLFQQFAPNFFSNPEAAYKGLQELKDFYQTYLSTSDPETRFGNKFNGKASANKGGQLMTDANGNKAMVYPDGSFEEVP